MPTPILVLQVGVPIKYHQRTLPFQVPHETRHTILRRNLHQQMDMIRLRTPFYDLNPFPFAQVSQYLYDTFSQFVVNNLPAILRGEYDMLFAHPFCVC